MSLMLEAACGLDCCARLGTDGLYYLVTKVDQHCLAGPSSISQRIILCGPQQSSRAVVHTVGCQRVQPALTPPSSPPSTNVLMQDQPAPSITLKVRWCPVCTGMLVMHSVHLYIVPAN